MSAAILDSHQHFWSYDPRLYGWIDESMQALRQDRLPQDLEADMRANGVDATIAVQARQDDEETRWLLELARKTPFVRGVVGWTDLQADDVERRLERLAHDPAIVGLRHVVQAEPAGFLDEPRFRRGLAAMGRYDIVYDILIRARQLPEATRFAAAFPRQRFVLDHLGKPGIRSGDFRQWRADLQALAALPHVSCKLSGLVTEADWHSWSPAQLRPYIDAALDAFGPSRLMFGSDWPVCTVAAAYGRVVALVRDAIAVYSASEQRQILRQTAETVYLSRLEHQS